VVFVIMVSVIRDEATRAVAGSFPGPAARHAASSPQRRRSPAGDDRARPGSQVPQPQV